MLSKKTLLCTEVLVAIGSAPPGLLVTTQALSDRLGTSVSHLESILRLLKAGGLVQSVRGPGGGYAIARAPDQISAWDVVSRVGEPEEVQVPRERGSRLAQPLESALHAAMQDYLASRTIGEFVRTDHAWPGLGAPVRSGFRLGPMPKPLLPFAPNSVFQLSAFMSPALA